MTPFAAGHEVIKTLGPELISGRDLSREFGTDWEASILNEAAVRAIGIREDPVGKPFGVDYMKKMGRIVGVVRDFHFGSLHGDIEPAVIQVMPYQFYAAIAVRIRAGTSGDVLGFLEDKLTSMAPNYPFEYRFLNDTFDRLYRNEERLATIFEYSAILAMLVACLGLFGLSYFTTELRIKEIGIRKTFGASVREVVFLLLADFSTTPLAASLGGFEPLTKCGWRFSQWVVGTPDAQPLQTGGFLSMDKAIAVAVLSGAIAF